MNPRFIPPARHASTGRSRVNSRSRPAESLFAESPASQTRRKLEELAIELGAKNSGAATSQISPGQRDSALASSSSGMAVMNKTEELRKERLQKAIAGTAQPKSKPKMPIAALHERPDRTPSFSQPAPKLGQRKSQDPSQRSTLMDNRGIMKLAAKVGGFDSMGCILQLTWMAWRLAVTNAQMENIKKKGREHRVKVAKTGMKKQRVHFDKPPPEADSGEVDLIADLDKALEHLSKIETMRPNRSDPPDFGPLLKLSRYSIEQQKLKLNKITAEEFAQAMAVASNTLLKARKATSTKTAKEVRLRSAELNLRVQHPALELEELRLALLALESLREGKMGKVSHLRKAQQLLLQQKFRFAASSSKVTSVDLDLILQRLEAIESEAIEPVPSQPTTEPQETKGLSPKAEASTLQRPMIPPDRGQKKNSQDSTPRVDSRTSTST